MAKYLANKKPGEVADYLQTWSDRLATGETISGSSWTVTSPLASDASLLTVDSDSNDDDSVTVWLSAGTAGTLYELTNTVTTSGGRTLLACYALYVEDC